MFKKFLVFVLLAAFLLISAPPAHSQSEPQYIYMALNGEAYANPYDPIALFIGWGVCRAPGLIHAYQNATTYVIEMNGVTIFDGVNSKDYWTPIELAGEDNEYCHNHPSDFYWSFWILDIGTLPIGDYNIVSYLTMEHQVKDLYDIEHYQNGVFYDVDGKPDKYGPGTDIYTVTLHVVE